MSATRLRTMGLPRQYTQGPGALDELGSLLAVFPTPFALVVDDVVASLYGQRLSQALGTLAQAPVTLRFAGECTVAEIDRLTAEARSGGCASVLAVGGGKAIDCGKGISRRLGLPIAVMPSVASNDAPTSRLIVVYDDDHAIGGVERMPWNPDMVVVDTAVIAGAPVRFLRAGIGDAISKRFEAEQVRLSGGRNFFDTAPLDNVGVIADQTYRSVLEHAEPALAGCERGEVTEALEHLVEATVLSSGVGFENGGLSIAHALTRGLTAVAQTRGALHGEMVAYGLLIQLRLGGGNATLLRELEGFYERIGLPRRLVDLGVERLDGTLAAAIAGPSAQAPYAAHFLGDASAEGIERAILEHEAASEAP